MPPNQARALFDSIIGFKKAQLNEGDEEQKAILNNFTIDSPIPYNLTDVVERLKELDREMTGDEAGRQTRPPARQINKIYSKVGKQTIRQKA